VNYLGVGVTRKELMAQIENALNTGISRENLVSQLKNEHQTGHFQYENFELLVVIFI